MLDIYNVLDAISEIVYVSDAETHEILYINEAGKKMNRPPKVRPKI